MKKNNIIYRLFLPIFLIFLISGFIFFIPPVNLPVILLLILLISIFSYFLLKIFLPKKIVLSTTVFVLIFLILSSLKLLDLMNFILLLSLFIGIFTLLK
ncbi:hypothetical protein A2767_00015 [Candidatus Roizmanbacteria bacterium RIFCSPHIGHO2_01_FULL_35_10]|uniref:Uncharacterized protein n=1 Tax=Candidatus Roizmanbacteria bacterium RIFCSPLOWO2_01_FULL_35_13 TaxID=1802055 RepID=A0A1F7IHB3_9BACT|nr:MAG: hypothetical protein A2767_00015 [Candidatus Roizmanbacteria bacterium RIFCSPHIGHO2_01_FULL_35_10]OGK42738.1 MAG: hypothetical protein A3A74_00805 [Candidatus Roizmanbacteria bacterium RIFCSPLOWO2_01_FULL_35_13]